MIAIVGGVGIILAVIVGAFVAFGVRFGWEGVRDLAAVYGVVFGVSAVVVIGLWLIAHGAEQVGWAS